MEINPTEETGSGVLEANDEDFEAKVLQKSLQVPVLVDFWAPWCGPCRVIGPVLEKLADQWQGRFELVKVNVDESPMLAQALRIQSIPAVKLFMNGTIQDEFMGAYPEPEVVAFLEKNLPSEQVEDAVKGIRLWQQGNSAGAMSVFQQVLAGDPNNPVALIGMGNCLLEQGDLVGAKELAGQINEVELEKLVEKQATQKSLSALKGRIFLLENAQPSEGDGTELAELFSGACALALQGEFETALENLLTLVRTDRKFKGDAGRLGMLAVFDLLPPDSPLLPDYRQKLSSILFS